MDTKHQKAISKFMSLVLRHKPQTIGITLNESGWVAVDELIEKTNAFGKRLTREELDIVVRENDKQRFQFSDDGTQIRASQGHSVEVELGYESAIPPETLHHGTPTQFVSSIQRDGLTKQRRHHVHLHADETIATSVGQRRGTPVLLHIDAKRMADAGYTFYVTHNEVWLTDHVPPEFIRFPEEPTSNE